MIHNPPKIPVSVAKVTSGTYNTEYTEYSQNVFSYLLNYSAYIMGNGHI